MRLDRQFRELRPGVMAAVEAVLASGRVLQGPEIERLESRLADLHGARHCVAVNSGTDALIFALRALGLPPGSRVAVTALSFVASAAAVVHAGLAPAFVDVDPDTLLADSGQLIELVESRRVAAVAAVHLYGQLADLSGVAAAARARGIPILEDAAQAIGARRDGRPAGAHGVATCLSFDPTKVIGAYGSGGAVLTSDDSIARKVRLLRYHGHAGDRVYSEPGFNSQMDGVQAAILCEKLERMEAWQARRAHIARQLDVAVGSVEALRPVRTLPGNTHNWHKYVIRSDRRDRLRAHLESRGVETGVHYSIPLHRQPAFGSMAMGVAAAAGGPSLPVVERECTRILSLPMYAELADDEVAQIAEALAGFGKSGAGA
jgi:dTDP-4-amino-4,6-dideoxygalactose transaminase